MTRFFPKHGLSQLLLGITVHLFLQFATAGAAGLPPGPQPAEISSKAKIVREIECYSLPYGGLGFLSHILTYYTVGCIGFGVKPLKPWDLSTRSFWNLSLAVVQLIATTVVAIITMHKCRNAWQFVLISVWQFLLSITIGFMSAHRSQLEPKSYRLSDPRTWFGKPLVSVDPLPWLSIFVIGVIIGGVGVISLVRRAWDHSQAVKYVTFAFACGGGFFSLVFAILMAKSIDYKDKPPTTFLAGLWGTLGVGLVAALYSDWVLGVIAGNLKGTPSRDNRVLYWIYFAFKRLPMLFQ